MLPLSTEGEPLAWGAFDMDAETFEFGTTTDAAGRFDFRDVAPGRYRAKLAAGRTGIDMPEQPPFEVLAGVPTELRLSVQRTGTIQGRVEFGNGVPVAERSLLLAEHDGDRTSAVIVSGRYELNGLLPGVWRLSVSDGEKALADRTVTLEPGEELEVDLVAQP
ncbi:MAG TPA: carboxypeptidase-like regulatory domain-containing protein [Planctomycetota bacterium]|nr:carboxypeptidase-like regulatory domain-containing protein [Planctomycetota bacterium]